MLRKVKKRKKNPPVYKLVRQSPLEQLNGYFGQTPTFVLDHPLNVIPGQMVALSLPTWAPNWAINLSDNNTWRSSRKSDPVRRQRDQEVQPRPGQGRIQAPVRLLLHQLAPPLHGDLVKKPRSR